MKARLTRKFGTCFLVLIIVGLGMVLGGDVTVKQGNLNVAGDLSVGDDLDVSGDAEVSGDLEVEGDIGICTIPEGYFWGIETHYLTAWYVGFLSDVSCLCDLNVYGTVYCGKIDGGWFDPMWVQYDKQTRTEIVESVKRMVPPEKQGGAVVFFNNETKRLETYIPSEGRFYDLQGNVVYALPKPEVLTTGYQTAYYIDNFTGEVRARQKLAGPTYIIKKGFTLDEKTGQFMNTDTSEPASREEALEIYVRGEGNYYDLQGNLIRSEPKAGEIQYSTQYYFDSLTGEVKQIRKPVYDRYVIKKGFNFDKNTGQFIDEATGEVVTKEKAIELKKG